MRETAFVVGFNLALASAFARVGGIAVGAAKTWFARKHFQTLRFGLVEAITALEPPLLALTAFLLLVERENAATVSRGDAVAALAGGLVALAGLVLAVWTLISWRTLFVGHGVLSDHQLVTAGAYRIVRHPVYLGGVLIWCGLSLCFLSPVAAAISAFYVLPAYLLYIRSEEKMMLEAFGDQYKRYRERVPMLLPTVRRPAR